MAAGSSSGIRIVDREEERKRQATAWTTFHGVDGEEEAAAAMARARLRGARECDVYVGHGGDARRMVAWLRAELEMLGVPCVATNRRQCGDAPAHAAARVAIDAALVGVVIITPTSLANPYAVEEVRAFLARGALVPVFVGGVRRRDFADADDVVERRGELWKKHGGRLWMLYDGEEEHWKEAVEGLAVASPAVEILGGASDLRDRVLDVLELVGARLGRRAVGPAVRAWRAGRETEVPFPRNEAFVGREKELADVDTILRGARLDDKVAGKRPMYLDDVVTRDGAFLDGVMCVTGESGAGKTELALEFVHRHWHEYKKVLWVHGEARYIRQSFLKLADHLGIAVGDPTFLTKPHAATSRTLHDIEGDAIAKIKKELSRDIPYLVVIDNLESETDWWDQRAFLDLLPRGCRRTRIIVTTRLAGGVHGVRTLELGDLDASAAMRLMKGTRAFTLDDMAVLRQIQETVASLSLALALVAGILNEVPIGPDELVAAMRRAPQHAPVWEARDDAALRHNPGMVSLLDACFALLGMELGAAAERVVEASSYFAPVPIPVAMLLKAAVAAAGVKTSSWKRFKLTVKSCASPSPAIAGGGGGEQAALAALLRLGVARWSTKDGCVSVHAVFRLFARRVVVRSGSGARTAVSAIAAAAGNAGADESHTLAACLSLFKFEASSAAVSLLPEPQLARFVTGAVLPLAARWVVGHSAYGAALEVLREATNGVLEAEERYTTAGGGGAAARRRRGGGSPELDLKVYRELARARAELLVMRARVMVRAGEREVAEDHCLSAVSILEVVNGDGHPDTVAVRVFLEQEVLVPTVNGSEPIPLEFAGHLRG